MYVCVFKKKRYGLKAYKKYKVSATTRSLSL